MSNSKNFKADVKQLYLPRVFKMKILGLGNKKQDLQKYIFKSTEITNNTLSLYILGQFNPFQILISTLK